MKLALVLLVIVISVTSIYAGGLRGSQEVQWQDANIAEGLYKIKTTYHPSGGQPAGWGLSAWHAHGAYRNSGSSWVYVHSGEKWPMVWKIVKGKKPNTYRLLTTHHAAGRQPAGWGLSAWNAHGARRNSGSSWTAVHNGDYWPMDWRIVKGAKPNTYRLLTTYQPQGRQPANWGLSAWQLHGGRRNSQSSRVAVHSGNHWPMDWTFERVDKPKVDPCLNCKNDVKVLTGKLGQSQNAATKASNDLAAAKKANTALLNSQKTLQSELASAKKASKELATSKGALQTKFEESSKANTALLNSQKTLQSELASAKKANKELASSQGALETKLTVAKEEIVKLKASHEDHKEEMENAKLKIASQARANKIMMESNSKQKKEHKQAVAELRNAHQNTKDHHAKHVSDLHSKHKHEVRNYRAKSGFTIAAIAKDRDFYKNQVGSKA